jgi:hypothetical protein
VTLLIVAGRRRRCVAAAAAAFVALLLPGCDEMRRPPLGEGLPVVLTPGEGDPARGVILAAAQDFSDLGRPLSGQPARAALAAARLEYLAAAIPTNPRFAPMTPSVGFALRGARDELRSALGTRAGAPPAAVIRALAGAATALQAGDRAAAARALPPDLFSPGGAETVQRLGALGPLPQAMGATQLVAQEMARLDVDRRWFGSAASDPAAAGGLTTMGLGGGGLVY